MKQHKSKLVKIVEKVDRKKALKIQNEKNVSVSSHSSKSDTESESIDSSVLLQWPKIRN